MKILIVVVCLFVQLTAFSQSMSYDTLIIPKRTAFLLPTDTLVANYLIMGDSSAIILGGEITVIKTLMLNVGVNCRIIGDGMDAGVTTSSTAASAINQAEDGENGKSLILVSSVFDSKSCLTIFLNGGNGGDGSLSCLPGSGGEGGNLLLVCADSEKYKIDRQILLKNDGGTSGRSPLSPVGAGAVAGNSLTNKKGNFKIVVY